MKSQIRCNICLECGDGHWAGEHKGMTDHNNFTLLYGGEDEPPGSLRKFITDRVYSSFGDRRNVGCRKMVNIQHLPSPNLAFRLRNDSFILDSF